MQNSIYAYDIGNYKVGVSKGNSHTNQCDTQYYFEFSLYRG